MRPKIVLKISATGSDEPANPGPKTDIATNCINTKIAVVASMTVKMARGNILPGFFISFAAIGIKEKPVNM